MTVTTEKLLTAEDLHHLSSQGFRGELLRGVLCETMPVGVRHGKTVIKLSFRLEAFVEPRQMGTILASDVGFLLEKEPDTVREPDVAFISARRLPLRPGGPRILRRPPGLGSRNRLPKRQPSTAFRQSPHVDQLRCPPRLDCRSRSTHSRRTPTQPTPDQTLCRRYA